MQRLQAREGTPTTGSQTVSQEVTPAPEERQRTPLVLHLRSTPSPDERRVTWDEDVIDNENMGKKSSKGTATHRLLFIFFLLSSVWLDMANRSVLYLS
jgi:hypothetical protein